MKHLSGRGAAGTFLGGGGRLKRRKTGRKGNSPRRWINSPAENSRVRSVSHHSREERSALANGNNERSLSGRREVSPRGDA